MLSEYSRTTKAKASHFLKASHKRCTAVSGMLTTGLARAAESRPTGSTSRLSLTTELIRRMFANTVSPIMYAHAMMLQTGTSMPSTSSWLETKSTPWTTSEVNTWSTATAKMQRGSTATSLLSAPSLSTDHGGITEERAQTRVKMSMVSPSFFRHIYCTSQCVCTELSNFLSLLLVLWSFLFGGGIWAVPVVILFYDLVSQDL
jgi:hypothetical protein